MRIPVKINRKTRVLYMPKPLVEEGFSGDVDAFSHGPIVVLVRPGADIDTISDSLDSAAKDIKLSPTRR